MKKALVIVTLILIYITITLINNENKTIVSKEETEHKETETIKIGNLLGKSIEDVKKITNNFNVLEEESPELEGTIIKQDKQEIKENEKVTITTSKGLDYKKYKVNELGNIPVMMYHGIVNQDNTKYIGGNVDASGYHRTVKAFKEDLEKYYKEGYRMIRLTDYIDGMIDVEAGFSPIVLTFDDGLSNNIKVSGLDEKGNIIIDPNSAVGILEDFKKKYDTPVTATFFINGGLFNQPDYNEKIIKWLVDNGYDVGNHTNTHVNFTKIDKTRTNQEVGIMYEKLENIIPGKYVNIIALPFGSPYNKTHANFSSILNTNYNGNDYKTKSTLRVGWEADYSPFDKKFDKTFIKRIRAYDNNGKDFDITMSFDSLKKNRYISDGNKNIITILENQKNEINENDLIIRTYN